MTTIVLISNGPTPICVDLYMKNSPHVAILTNELKSWQFLGEIKTGKFKKKQNTNVPILKDIPIQIQKVSKISPTEF